MTQTSKKETLTVYMWCPSSKTLGRISEVYSERSQTSKMERFAKINNKFKALIIIIANRSTLDV